MSLAAVLFAHGHLDAQQYGLLGQVTYWLQALARNLGPRGIAIAGLWAAVTGAAISTV